MKAPRIQLLLVPGPLFQPQASHPWIKSMTLFLSVVEETPNKVVVMAAFDLLKAFDESVRFVLVPK